MRTSISSVGLTAIGTELFHWTSPNCISIGSVENCTVGCIETGCCGIDDCIRRFVNFCSLLSKFIDCVGSLTNTYSSIGGEIICGISSVDDFDGKDVSLGIGWNEVLVLVFDFDDDGMDLLDGFERFE